MQLTQKESEVLRKKLKEQQQKDLEEKIKLIQKNKIVRKKI